MGGGGDGDHAWDANNKDPAIKLFGRTIALPESLISVNSQKNIDPGNDLADVKQTIPHRENSVQPEKNPPLDDDEENQTSVPIGKAESNTKLKEEQEDSNSAGQEKGFKKPDKIIPCPRCNSMETKFCYFNNYNVNQPRHFCKNCQRYWTAGGTMRNVPVGAGRRRNKHLASQYRQILVSADGVQTTRLETPESANHQVISVVEPSASSRPSTGNGTVLKFGPETPLCESMENVLSLRDQMRGVEIGSSLEEPSLGSTTTGGNELLESIVEREQVNVSASCNGVKAQTKPHCYPVPPWFFPLNPSGSQIASDPNIVPPTTALAVPGYCTPGIPLQFVTATSWGGIGMPIWASTHGNLTLVTSNGCPSPTSSTSNNSCCSANGFPTLGKHSRDINFVDNEEKSDKCVLIPKTLRMDDPNEASKSSIWAALGIKPHHKECISKGTNFKRFERKTEILEANPAALSRAYKFQEST